MATRSFIGVVVNPQDNGKTISPSLELLGKDIESHLAEAEFHDTVIELYWRSSTVMRRLSI